jgi:hypothetical protein
MRDELQAFSSQGGQTQRRLNSDGTITIICKVCGKPLHRGLYQGFSTAKCSDCAGVPTDDVITGATTLPDGRVIYQPKSYAEDSLLYPEGGVVEKVGLARAVFRALGFGRPKEPKPPEVESRKVSRGKRRRPIFGAEEKE